MVPNLLGNQAGKAREFRRPHRLHNSLSCRRWAVTVPATFDVSASGRSAPAGHHGLRCDYWLGATYLTASFRTRFPIETYRLPCVSIAISVWPEKSPSLPPGAAHWARYRPAGDHFWIRLLPMSPTYMLP